MKSWFLLCICLIACACSDSTKVETSETSIDVVSAESEVAGPAIVSEELSYLVDSEPFTGFLAYDKNQKVPRPGILVVHEWWGHNEYARSRALQLAEMGYVALALDMYGSGKLADHPDTAMAFMQAAVADPQAVRQRFLTAKSLLQQNAVTDADKIAAIGYCFGGAVVLNMARAGIDLDGVASFHGSLEPVTPALPDVVSAKMLVLNGAADPFVPQEQIDAFKAEMDAAGVDYDFVNYLGVQHSFTNPAATDVGEKFGMPLAYDEQADNDSWRRLGVFLKELWSQP